MTHEHHELRYNPRRKLPPDRELILVQVCNGEICIGRYFHNGHNLHNEYGQTVKQDYWIVQAYHAMAARMSTDFIKSWQPIFAPCAYCGRTPGHEEEMIA